eukprot:TRINITY_DN6089_c0_g1_i1.p1 TRINITY_DN6089_c0_g1~~TRINITY_DN6089_c0_g1_i1.p1  ORF type:complete len:571 (+),score=137.21 TRINITY_DN6089_c0_g1_i1:58-1770(+)
MAQVTGAEVIVRALKQLGVKYMFGIVGIPVTDIAITAQQHGIKYYSFRNEQAASYAAGAVGYLTGTPGVCLAVSGPGMIHAIAGLANAWANCWPMLLLAGKNDQNVNDKGAFQEAPQLESARLYSKYIARVESIERIPAYLDKAIRVSTYGRPGAVYLELPGDIISGTISENQLTFPSYVPPPITLADPANIIEALNLLSSAKRPLVIFGKGASYSRAENEALQFIEQTGIPFIPTPMGKGLVSDLHPQNVIPARSLALSKADVVLLVGARLNWILHFGAPPRWSPDVKIIQIDIEPEEISANIPTTVPLVGDIKAVLTQFLQSPKLNLFNQQSFKDSAKTWFTQLNQVITKNKKTNEALAKYPEGSKELMNYYQAFSQIKKNLPNGGKDVVIVSEGANTMDIGRSIFDNLQPRERLDAGTFGTMGVGLGFAIAAAVVYPEKRVLMIEGDSAFGFSGMEVETICRYKLPITIVIINNNGISMGVEDLSVTPDPLPFVYTPSAHYEKMADIFGGKGWFVTNYHDVPKAVNEAFAVKDSASIVNVMISINAARREQSFAWHTRQDENQKSNL